ncbi:MAG: hypothetical protein PHX91_05055 [Prevotella sp.]|nr:hypothetical protein [Prevotella sp.]
MGQFDIQNKFNEDCSVSWHSLYMELVSELEDSNTEEFINEDTIRDKFTNNDGSGLVDKLKSVLDFDIRSIVGKNKSECFDMFKILKLLFYIEKYGEPKTEVISKNYRIQITDILAKPRLSNVPSDYTSYSVYGEYFNQLYADVKKAVSDADERELRLEKINAYWEYVTEKVFDYVINDRALSEPEEALKELERINRFLKEKVLDKLKAHNVIKLSKPEKVLPAFFNLLACHKLLCNENDRIRINYEICLTSQPDAEYIENFKKYEGIEAKWEVLPLIKDRLKGKNEDPDADIALYFISYGKEIDDTDIKHYKYAADKAKTVASWIENYKCANFNGGIPLDMLVIIMQELIDNKKNGDKITNDYYGYNNKYRSLMTAVKNPETADAVVLQAWIKKLENRIAVNIGAFNLIQKKREIETTIYEIKSIIYSYRNLDDLEFVNSTISHFAARAITSRDLAMTIGNRFAEKVANNLKGKAKRMTNFYMWSEGINVMDMFREFLVDTQNIEDCVAEEVARQINEFYEEDDSIISRGMRVDFEVYVSEKYCKDFLLIYYIDKSKDTLTYQKFYEVCSDADAARMKSLGLEKFVITE